MTSTGLTPRPRQLALAAGVVIAGAGFLVLAVFDSLSTLNSLDVRDQMRTLVGSTTGRSLGMDVDQVIATLRVILSVTAVCAAIALVLGIFVLQRHRGARVGLSVVAVPLLLTSPVVGGFLGALVAAATVTLWTGPSRDWYDGKPIREPAPRRPREPRPAPPPAPVLPPPAVGRPAPPVADPPSTSTTSGAPGATQGFGAPASAPLAPPATGWPPAYPPQAPYPAPAPPPGQPWQVQPGRPPGARGAVPGPVKVACVLTWVFSGVVVLLYLAALVILATDRASIVDRVVSSPEWKKAGLGADVVTPMLWAGIVLFIAWGVGAMVLAWFTWRRRNWARWLLGASALLTLLALTLVFPVGAAHQIACAVTLSLLFGPRARLWFAGDVLQLPPPPPPRGGPW